jgi:hypothetical protein
MSEARDKMVSALKEIVVPCLRDMGFRGSFPHFRRSRDGQLDLLMFQFSQFSRKFCVEVSYCELTGCKLHTGEMIPADRARVYHQNPCRRFRLRVRPATEHQGQWLPFGLDSDEIYSSAASEILPLLRTQAEHFWQKHTDPITPLKKQGE